MRTLICALGIAAGLSACSSSSSILVGTARPAIAPTAVKLYLSPPAVYERVALLESSSKASMAITDQGKTDKMIERLKEEAAKVGANGVLLTGSGKQQDAGGVFIPNGMGGGIIAPGAEHKAGTGLAIYVTQE